jgi:phosphoglucosamine mutase
VAPRAREDYIDHLASTVTDDLAGLHILVDCANGAASATACRLFARFPKLRTDVINADPDGVNINLNCGSTHLDALAAMVKAGGYHIGIAFDGDADRCLAVDETGAEIDGDQIMAICGLEMKREGRLPGDAIVATVMSNLGLRLFAKEHDLTIPVTDVGDRNVLEKMEECGYALGGEQSGHMIFRQFATTGDGELTALQLLQILHRSGLKASELFSQCKKYPQYLINIPVADNAMKAKIMGEPELQNRVKREEEALAGEGRVLVRPSGTEALIRVMVEGKDPDLSQTCARNLAEFIRTL